MIWQEAAKEETLAGGETVIDKEFLDSLTMITNFYANKKSGESSRKFRSGALGSKTRVQPRQVKGQQQKFDGICDRRVLEEKKAVQRDAAHRSQLQRGAEAETRAR